MVQKGFRWLTSFAKKNREEEPFFRSFGPSVFFKVFVRFKTALCPGLGGFVALLTLGGGGGGGRAISMAHKTNNNKNDFRIENSALKKLAGVLKKTKPIFIFILEQRKSFNLEFNQILIFALFHHHHRFNEDDLTSSFDTPAT